MVRSCATAAVVALVAFAGVLLHTGPAYGCSCLEMPSPCAPAEDVVIFTGRVAASEPYMESMTRYRINVSEVFKGEIASRSIAVATPAGVATCGYPFEEGKDYLVFAWKTDEGVLYTGLCTLTGPVASSRDYLELLREMKRGSVQTRLRGLVSEAVRRLDGSPNNMDFHPVDGVEVTASGDAGTFKTKTSAGGTFLFKGLPQGAYRISAALPPGYAFQGWPESLVTLDACLATTTISTIRTPLEGTVLDSSGTPLATPVRVVAVLAGERREAPARSRTTSVLSEPDGTWRLDGLPAGRYYIGTALFESPDDTPFQPWWYGAASRQDQPAAVNVSHERLTRVELRVGPLFERTELHGVIVDTRGLPVANANVVLTDVDSGRDYLFAAFTGPDGRFTIPAVRGRRYKIGAGNTLQSAVQDVADFSSEIRIVIDALIR